MYLTGSVFSSNYTVPKHPRVIRRAGTVDARDAANLFSPSLEISDDVRTLLPPVLLQSKLFRRVRESQERFIKARISQYIFKIVYTPSMYTGSRATTKICRCAKNQKWTSRGPLKIRGEHPPRCPRPIRAPFPSTFSRVLHLRWTIVLHEAMC